MCGLFGALCLNPAAQIQPHLLQSIAYEAGRRGPQAWGVAWTQRNGLQSVRRIGRLTEQSDLLPGIISCSTTLACIGQARLTTSGDYRVAINNQPLVSSDGQLALVHNGNVPHYRELADRHGFSLQTANDSEVLLQLLAKRRGDTSDDIDDLTALTETLAVLPADIPYVVLSLTPTALLAARRGLPLFFAVGAETLYFCSRPFRFDQSFSATGELIESSVCSWPMIAPVETR